MDLLTNYVGVIVPSFKFYCFRQSLSGTKWYIKSLGIFLLFRDFSLHDFWSVKLTEILRVTTNTIFPQTCCLSSEYKIHISGFNDKIFAKFEFKFQKGQILDNFLLIFADVSRNICFTVFYGVTDGTMSE